jgi:soluble lytic murein transglycosylase-like protein
MLTRTLLAVTLTMAVWPAHADAQIYAWRDANGTLVLSDRSIDRPTAVYEVEGAPRYVSTTPVESTSARDLYEPYVLEYSNRQSLRPELVRAVIQVESGYNPRALSPKGAMGLMQLMPETAQMLGVKRPYDPEQNIRGGTRYLRLLLDKYQGNEELALAAYNAGSGAVDRHGKRIPPYRETRDYVRKVGSVAGEAPVSRRKLLIYKTLEILDGRAVPRYSSEKPSSGSFEIISR